MSRLQRFLAILYPAALVTLVEALAVVFWSGVERSYLPRPAGLAALAVLAGAALVAGVAAQVSLPSPRAWLSIAWGTTVVLSGAMALANGAPPRYVAGGMGPGTAVFVLWLCALGAGLLRFVLPRPVDRGRALLLEPALLAAVTAVPYVVLHRLGFPVTALRTMAPWAAVIAGAAGVLALLASRGRPDAVAPPADRTLPWRERLARADGSTRAALSLSLWIAAAAAAAAALGRTPFAPMHAAAAAGPPDVLLVVLDTVRADALVDRLPPAFFLPSSVALAQGPARLIAEEFASKASFGAPHLTALAGSARRFSNAFSTSCWTVPAHASLFTGMEAERHGVGWRDPYLPADLPSLAARLRGAGWRTAGYSANPWISPEFRFDRGFDRFVTGDVERRPWIPWLFALVPAVAEEVDASLLWEDKDGLVLASEAVRTLSRSRRPAFVFLNLMEAHLPYAPPDRVLARGLAGTGESARGLRQLEQEPLMDLRPGFRWSAMHLAGLRALYAAEVSYVDDLLGRIVERLRQSGRLERTILVIAADHGENLGEHPPLDHQLGLWDTLVRVPLLVHLPDGRGGGVVDDRLVSLADLAPSIEAWAAGQPAPLDGPPGRDAVTFTFDLPSPILERIRDRLALDPAPWAQALSGIRTAEAKWVLGTGGYQYVTKLRDGNEGSNWFSEDVLPGVEPPFRELRDRLTAIQATPARARQPIPALSPEAEARLRSLGYVK
ncbi:MAG TPA: sulfatase [Candidatus Polarisedimenticolaceae bacterium]|nr:sulfatase [Candidatus Polarisedimenticolaceae bacterium]